MILEKNQIASSNLPSDSQNRKLDKNIKSNVYRNVIASERFCVQVQKITTTIISKRDDGDVLII